MRRSVSRLILALVPISWLALAPAALAEYVEIGNAELRRLLADGTTIVDVRRADEWRHTGVIENSHRITFFDQLGRFDAERWLVRLTEIAPSDKPLILICDAGVRSRVIGYWLNHRLGFAQVYNVRDGIAAWMAADLPVVPVPD